MKHSLPLVCVTAPALVVVFEANPFGAAIFAAVVFFCLYFSRK